MCKTRQQLAADNLQSHSYGPKFGNILYACETDETDHIRIPFVLLYSDFL